MLPKVIGITTGLASPEREMMLKLGLLAAVCLSTAACATDSGADIDTITQEAKRPSRDRSMVGFWRTKAFAEGAWVDLIWVVGRTHAWHAVIAYADEELTIPLVRWDALRRYKLEAPVDSTHNMTWNDVDGRLYAHVDNPELFAGIGIDDCNLEVGVSRDLTVDNCGAPLFPFRDCTLMDYARIEGDSLTFGAPGQGDRCVARPTTDGAWTFERVPFSAELGQALFATPW